jgi:hypothetical protein
LQLGSLNEIDTPKLSVFIFKGGLLNVPSKRPFQLMKSTLLELAFRVVVKPVPEL